ncbi:MAG: DUF4124 domain-containing protein [Burkholderiaceae bacterium]|jgi:hypothetical protein|nr:DUF4124 domain-containing protein [Burkholderiaceae bacterium]
MRSRTERTLWTALAVVLVLAAAAAWWTAERWAPHAGPWARQTWLAITRPSPPPGHPRAAAEAASPKAAASAPAPLPRKCVQGERTVYTDQPCPPGSKEQPMDPALSVLPQ